MRKMLFTSPQFYDSEIVDLAFLILFKRIVLSGDPKQSLVSTVARNSRQGAARFFTGIIRLWLEFIDMQVNVDVEARNGHTPDTLNNALFISFGSIPEVEVAHTTFCSREKGAVMKKAMNIDAALHNMLIFATGTAQQNMAVRLGMLDAGSLALVLTAFTNADFMLSSLTVCTGTDRKASDPKSGARRGSDAQRFPCISQAAINAEASTLSVFMHSTRFNNSWHGQRLNSRLSLCSSLVYSLLGKEEVVDGGYEMTRALFRKIVERVVLLD